MSNYVKLVDYAAKDALLTGNPSKLVKGAELGPEFDAVATAVATKADSISPTLTTPALGTPASGVLTNCTGTAAGLTAGNATTAAACSGNAATVTTNANLTGHVTSVGNAAVLGSFSMAQLDTAVNDGNVVFQSGALGTPASGTLTNCSGTAASLTAGNATTAAACSGNTAGSAATFTSTTQNSQFNSIGVGTAGSGTGGEIRATNNITAYYSSDKRLKTKVKPIRNALDIIAAWRGVFFDWKASVIKSRGGEDGYFVRKHDAGVIADEIEATFPQAVAVNAEGFKAVRYDLLVPVLINAINELRAEVERLK